MEITMLFRTFTAANILALGMTAAYADNYSSTSVNVPFGDLNLSQPADAKILGSRLQDAAKSVCLKANPEIPDPTLMRGCIDDAIKTAMGRIETSLEQPAHAAMDNVRTSMESP
jgi:UrcA family protein